MPRLRPQFTYANVTSTIALCLAVGGGSAYAATTLAKNSVKSSHIAKGAVQSSDIKDGTVELRDLAASVTGKSGNNGANGSTGSNGKDGVSGLRGPEGPAGPTGPAGPAGKDVSFDGVRLGPLTRYEAFSGTANMPTHELTKIGDIVIGARCWVEQNLFTRSQIVLQVPAGSGTKALVLGGTAQYGYDWIEGGEGYTLETSTNGGAGASQWAATILVGNTVHDVRGISYRQSVSGSYLPPQGRACGFTAPSVEKASR